MCFYFAKEPSKKTGAGFGEKQPFKANVLRGERTSLVDHFNKPETNSQAEEASTSENQPTQPVVAESVPVDISEQKDLAVNLQCNICLGVPLTQSKHHVTTFSENCAC